jgi:hypothetical protein
MESLQSIIDLQARFAAQEARIQEEISRLTAEWEEAINRLEAQRSKAQAALAGLAVALEAVPDLPESTDEEGSTATLKDRLLELVLVREDPIFTAPELYQELEAKMSVLPWHKASVSSAVKQLQEDGAIKLLSEARGRRAAVYARYDYEEIKPTELEVTDFSGETDM